MMIRSINFRALRIPTGAVALIALSCSFVFADGSNPSKAAQATGSTGATQTQGTMPSQTTLELEGVDIDKHYVLGPEDVLAVTVENVPEDSGNFLVRPDGHISFPIVGDIMVAGHSVQEVEQMLVKGLSSQLRDPHVSVNIQQMRKNRIYIDGAVRQPSSYDYKKGWRISELIATAGGLTDEPQRLTAVLYEPGHETEVIPLRKIYLDVDEKSNLPVAPGDSLYIRQQPTMLVTTVGEVTKPGITKIYEGQGAVQALAESGGATQRAALSKAEIIRDGQVIPVDLYDAVINGDMSKNVIMEPHDSLVVPQNYRQVSVIGTVSHPGPVLIPDGRPLTLSQSIGDAGGLAPRAKQSVVLTTVGADGKLTQKDYDLKTLGTKGHPDPILKDKDVVFVPQSGAASFYDLLNLSQLYYTVRSITNGF